MGWRCSPGAQNDAVLGSIFFVEAPMTKQERRNFRQYLQRKRERLEVARYIKFHAPTAWAVMSNDDRLDFCRRESIVSLRKVVACLTGVTFRLVPEAASEAINAIAARDSQGHVKKRDEHGRIPCDLETENLYRSKYGYYSERTQLGRAA
jgi:hypothetical protein